MATITEHTSDEQLRDAVLRQLEWQPEIQSKQISIKADQGLITLTGFVHTYPEKLAAEEASKSIYGVKAVANGIEVMAVIRADEHIMRDILEALRLDLRVPYYLANVTVRDGLVTLDGTAEWHYQRVAAESCARGVAGVCDVANSIKLKSHTVTRDIRLKIEEALCRNADVGNRKIAVSLHSSTVILSGRVRSWLEKKEAQRAAWAAPGISRVIDQISVFPNPSSSRTQKEDEPANSTKVPR